MPAPELAIIQTIDDDVRCDGTDATHVKAFGASVQDALQVIARASPRTRISMITQPGRPSLELQGMAPLPATNTAARQVYTGDGPCDPLGSSGKVVPTHVAALTSIIASYEAEQARVCASFPTCRTDRRGLASFRRDPSLVAGDYNHLNVAGQARLAAAVWPYAQAALAPR